MGCVLMQCAVGLSLAMCAAVASASPEAARPAGQPASSCLEQSAAGLDVLGDREEQLARYEALPPQCLKSIVVTCSEAANAALLDLGQAATCSIGYEALLNRGFNGNFQALMAWWRQRNQATAFQ
jgi:hypothetical protein